MAERNLVDGLMVREDKRACSHCAAGKTARVPHPMSLRERASKVGEVVHADLIGKISPMSLGSNSYLLLLTDEYSKYKVCYPLRTKDETVVKVEEYCASIE